MVLPRDVGQVETRYSPFGNSVWFAPNVPWACKSSQAHPMVLLGDIGQVQACFQSIWRYC
jgi:hypothetical protein